MIPKIIHYCWFGTNPIPKDHLRFIEEWKLRLPDYQFRLWHNEDLEKIDVPVFVLDALRLKKYAFVADYVRLYALYNYGGIYLDTDVRVLKDFEPYLENKVFSSVEYHPTVKVEKSIDKNGNRIDDTFDFSISIHSAIIASIKKHSFIKDCLDYYQEIRFSEKTEDNFTIPKLLAIKCEAYGFKYIDTDQKLKDGIRIYPSNVFAEYRTCNRHSVAIHYCEGSWLEPTLRLRLMKYVKKNPLLFKCYQFYKHVLQK